MMVRSYGAIFFILTGLSMITANLIYACVRNPTDLLIPVGEGFLRFHWGWCFWLCLATGEYMPYLHEDNLVKHRIAFLLSYSVQDYEQKAYILDIALIYVCSLCTLKITDKAMGPTDFLICTRRLTLSLFATGRLIRTSRVVN